MIRVLYRWRVSAGADETFVSTRREITEIIRAHCQGARGSMILKDGAKDGEYAGFALWDSREDWEAAGNTVYPPEVSKRRKELRQVQAPISTLYHTEVFEVLEDLSL